VLCTFCATAYTNREAFLCVRQQRQEPQYKKTRASTTTRASYQNRRIEARATTRRARRREEGKVVLVEEKIAVWAGRRREKKSLIAKWKKSRYLQDETTRSKRGIDWQGSVDGSEASARRRALLASREARSIKSVMNVKCQVESSVESTIREKHWVKCRVEGQVKSHNDNNSQHSVKNW